MKEKAFKGCFKRERSKTKINLNIRNINWIVFWLKTWKGKWKWTVGMTGSVKKRIYLHKYTHFLYFYFDFFYVLSVSNAFKNSPWKMFLNFSIQLLIRNRKIIINLFSWIQIRAKKDSLLTFPNNVKKFQNKI